MCKTRTASRWPSRTICLYINAPVPFQMLYNNSYVITFYTYRPINIPINMPNAETLGRNITHWVHGNRTKNNAIQ